VHIGDYGAEQDGAGLLEVLQAVEEVEGLHRFRVSSIEATYLTDAMIDFFARSPKFCRHLHVPLQSGDDGILKAMRRPYTRARYMDLLSRIADRIPDVGIGADVMVGFPGESDAAFRATCDVVEGCPVVFLHVFPYSPREGTPASRMPQQVDPKVKKARSAHLRQMGRQKAEAFQRRFLGTTVEVLLEGRRDSDGTLQGVTDNYIRVLTRGPDSARNRLHPVRLERLEDGHAFGRLVEGSGPDEGLALIA
jgi:threonylcarbamoyladenosine tRNA methylthiotransferase MtaB